MRETDACLFENPTIDQYPALAAATAVALPFVTAKLLPGVGVLECVNDISLQRRQVFLYLID
jgi:hypothetical protein